MRIVGASFPELIHTTRRLWAYTLGLAPFLWIGGRGEVLTRIPELVTSEGGVFAQGYDAHAKAALEHARESLAHAEEVP
jgi:hypothetical protein